MEATGDGFPGGFPAAGKRGAFVNWTEDEESSELKLPLPEGTRKTDIKACFTPTSFAITLRSDGTTLLAVSPLAARIVSDETTWYIEQDTMTITLAKMQGVGASDSAQLWGQSLQAADAKGGTFECWLTPEKVAERLGLEPPANHSSAGTDWTMVSMAVSAVVLVVAMVALFSKS
jgi:hypothetical protein